MKSYKFVYFALIVSSLVCANAFAEEATLPAGMDAEKMAKMKEAMAPGEAHKALQPLEGRWNYTAQHWMTPEAKAETMTGTAVHEWIYGGRFLKQTVSGTWMGQPWEGLGYTGYDNLRKEYQSVWLDGMMTGMMWSQGEYDGSTKTLKTQGTAACPLTGDKNMKMRSELKVVDNDHHTLTMYSTMEGKEHKGMEIQYTRA